MLEKDAWIIGCGTVTLAESLRWNVGCGTIRWVKVMDWVYYSIVMLYYRKGEFSD